MTLNRRGTLVTWTVFAVAAAFSALPAAFAAETWAELVRKSGAAP